MSTQRDISIWFFIGVSLLVNGALIFGAGIYELVRPPQYPVVLFHLHANVWWGAILLIMGAVYCVKFAPTREKKAKLSAAVKREEIHAQ